MPEVLTTYRTMAVLVWAAVAVVVGLAAGSFFDLSARQQIFPVVLGAGAYGLLLVRMYGHIGLIPDSNVSEQMAPEASVSGGNGEAVTELLRRDEGLSPDEARDWLDEFLVQQQR